jgi:hypothetical protein
MVDSTNTTSPKEPSQKKHKVRAMWKLVYWVQVSGFLRPFFKVPLPVYTFYGHLVGKLMFAKQIPKIKTAYKVLFPDMPRKVMQKKIQHYISYLGTLVLDSFLVNPNIAHQLGIKRDPETRKKFHYYIDHKNAERFDNEYIKGKGVIVPTFHTGQFFHVLGTLICHTPAQTPDTQVNIATIGEAENADMYRPITEAHPNYYVFKTGSFAQLMPQMKEKLEKGWALVLYFDYASRKGLLVPFGDPPNNFLRPVPQSVALMHRITGAPIVPAIVCPNECTSRSITKYLDNSRIMAVSKQYWDAPQDEFVRRVSFEVNRTMTPYILKYATFWEQALALGNYVYRTRIEFDAGITRASFLERVKAQIYQFLNKSWEPHRDDQKITELVDQEFQNAAAKLQEPEKLFKKNKSWFNYFDRGSIAELQKLVKLTWHQLKLSGEMLSAAVMDQLYHKLGQLKQTIALHH